MQSKTSALASLRVRYVLRAVRSVFSVEKKLSIAELSQTLPARLMLQVIPSSPSSRWNCSLLYWAESSGRCNISILEVLDGTTKRLGNSANRTSTNAFAWAAGNQSARGEAGILETYCRRADQRGCGAGQRCLATIGHAMVSGCGGHATGQFGATDGALSGVCRT